MLVNRFNHTSGMTAVTPTDLPKSVRNRCVIEVFGSVFYVVTLLFYVSVDVGAFVIGLSQISSFFSYVENTITMTIQFRKSRTALTRSF